MYVLAIETTGAFASVALMQMPEKDGQPELSGCRLLGALHGEDRFSHLQKLTPQIEEILRNNALSIGDVSAIAVSHGPGSFTGIRIGVATARALAQVLKIPCVAVSSLEALALRAQEGEVRAAGSDAPLLLCPILDARRTQVYGAGYTIRDGKLVCEIEPSSSLIADFLPRLDHWPNVLFLGDGIDTCGEYIRQWRTEGVAFAEKEKRYQDAAAVGLRGCQLLQEGRGCHYMELQPEYLRMAEAERKLRERQARKG